MQRGIAQSWGGWGCQLASQGKGCSWHSCGQKAPKDLEKMGEKAGQGICDKPTVSAHGTSWDYRQRLGLGDSKESFGL